MGGDKRCRAGKYPKEVQDFITEHSTEYSRRELAEELKERFNFEKTPEALHSWCSARKLCFKPRKGRQCPELSKYPKEMHAFVREVAAGRSYKDIAQMINERFGDGTINGEKVRSYLKNHKIKTGRTGCFQKGHVPWSKGKKIDEVIKDPKKRQRFYENQFRKGDTAHNTLPVGTIVKNCDGYLMRKKQMEGGQWERWEFLHRAVWEEHNGPIQEGMLIAFKDSNPENCVLENLMLISKAEHAAMNIRGYRCEDPEMTTAGLTIIRINRRMGELSRKRRKSDERKADNGDHL